MRSRGLFFGALCAAMVAVNVAAPAEAAEPARPITLELAQVPLSRVIQLLAANGNVEIVFNDPEGKLADRQIALLTIKERPIDVAMEIICRAANVTYEKGKDGIYYISATKMMPMTEMRPAVPQPAVPEVAPLPVPEEQELVTEKIVLDYINPDDCLRFLTTSHSKRPLGEAGRYKNLEELQVYPGLIDPTTKNWYLPSNALPQSPIMSPGATKGAAPGITGGNQFGGSFSGGGGGLGSGGGLGGGGGLGSSGGLGGGGLGGGGGGANLVPDGIQGILGYPLDNSLLVRGTLDDIQALKDIIRMLDIPPRQISIKIEQIAVTSEFSKDFGIDFTVSNGDISIDTDIGQSTGGSISVGVLGNGWRVNFAAAQAQGKATVVDSILVTTMNNVTATITQTQTTTVFFPVVNQVQGAGLVTTYQAVQLPAQSFLFATPRVNGDGTITMLIPFVLSRFLGESVGPDGQRVPNIVSTNLFALRRVASGQTIVVGGITNRDDRSSSSGIPILRDLPFIGSLFKNRRENRINTETLFFFTPTLLPENVATGGEPTTR